MEKDKREKSNKRDIRRDTRRGAVLAEFVIALVPVLMMTFGWLQLAWLYTADLLAKHAASTCVRAAVVVDPKPFNPGKNNGTLEDIQTATQKAANVEGNGKQTFSSIRCSITNQASEEDVFGTVTATVTGDFDEETQGRRRAAQVRSLDAIPRAVDLRIHHRPVRLRRANHVALRSREAPREVHAVRPRGGGHRRDDVGFAGGTMLSLNGQKMLINYDASKKTVREVLDAAEEACRAGEVKAPRLDADSIDPNRMMDRALRLTDLGVVSSDDEGAVLCFARGAETPDGLLAQLEKFGRTNDLGSLGKMRYVFARKEKKGTAVLAAISDDSFRLDALRATKARRTRRASTARARAKKR